MTAPFQVAAPLSDDVRRALAASIESFGVLVPVVRDQHGRIIDGHHRSQIAENLGVDVPVEVVKVASDEHARTLAVTLNADRRQMSAEERRAVVAHLRAEGHSVRATAEAVGVSHTQVRRDAGQLEPDVPVAQSEGLDGRVRPASEEARRAQRREIAAVAKAEPEASHRQIARQIGASHHTVKSVREQLVAPAEPEAPVDDDTKRVGRLLRSIEDELDEDPTPLHAIAIVQAAERQLDALDRLDVWPDHLRHLLDTVRAAADRLTALVADLDRQDAA